MGEFAVGGAFRLDGSLGVEDGGVVAAAEVHADFLEAEGGELAGEVHGDLSWVADGPGALTAEEFLEADAVVIGDGFDDVADAEWALVGSAELFEGVAGGFDVEGLAGELGFGDELGEGAFEEADVGFDVFGDDVDDFVWDFDAAEAGFLVQDGLAGFAVGRVDLDDEAPVEAADESVFEGGDFGGGGVGGEDDLATALIENVECMEQFFLAGFAAGEELDVVDDEEIGFAGAFAEGLEVASGDGLDEVVDEGFAGDVDGAEIGIGAEDFGAGGLEEVGLAEAGGAVDEQGVIECAELVAAGSAGGVGEAI